jgi:hypothetical protein
MEEVNPKKWDVRKLQESKEIKQEYQRKFEENRGKHKRRKCIGKLEEDRKSNIGSSR